MAIGNQSAYTNVYRFYMERVKKLVKAAIPAALMGAPLLALGIVTPDPTNAEPLQISDIIYYINLIMGYLLGIAMTIAVIFIVWGGITWIAAGGDDTKVKTAKARVKNGIIGAAVILAVGLILNTIQAIITRQAFL